MGGTGFRVTYVPGSYLAFSKSFGTKIGIPVQWRSGTITLTNERRKIPLVHRQPQTLASNFRRLRLRPPRETPAQPAGCHLSDHSDGLYPGIDFRIRHSRYSLSNRRTGGGHLRIHDPPPHQSLLSGKGLPAPKAGFRSILRRCRKKQRILK